MKKAKNVLFLVCALSLTLLIGIFFGRNMAIDDIKLKENEKTISISEETVSKDYRLDINLATKIQLMELPGIGETIASRIIQYREDKGTFSSIDELLYVEGIGNVKLQQIEPYIRIGG